MIQTIKMTKTKTSSVISSAWNIDYFLLFIVLVIYDM